MQLKPTFILLGLSILLINCKQQSEAQIESSDNQVHGRFKVTNHNS